ncbi:UDP-N-acetylglucosamine--LPS N-acetylglucosamine transferase [Pseudoduganella namucuonensis]|uniref:Oligosaccharide biosynthesis protein Alg14 like n=1 Tax=Pseudoduganella namucuonensis TaxID=1035707 RepID=A0A1I7I0J1_9BURK|nr:UDP-N-acetylglucosamine--LPS N-acetylglucosamine transferase [Pseudoduganella namucuonensis]SFU66463.1 Oligosaccharide biosynthesis protein Alg14 like [Pseudoduganella namucuonensis]
MTKKILAVASGGGHWVQMLRLRPAFEGQRMVYVTVQPSYASQVPGERFYAVTDATRWSRWDLVKMICQVGWIVLKERPDVVVTTGAAPGVVALRVGKLLGAKTVWLDSIANVEHMSMSGQRVRRFADLWLTQWQHLAKEDGPGYKGGVL